MDTYHVTMDSFGDKCPTNWEEIAGFLNHLIDGELEKAGEVPEYGDITPEGNEIVFKIWESFCRGELSECPEPVFSEEE